MTYIPSETLVAALEGSRVGLWIDKMHQQPAALVCKMPEVAIKALHQGAGCTLVVGVVRIGSRRVLCRGLRVEDDPDHPLSVVGPSLVSDDLQLLHEILRAGSTRLICVNELNHPMLGATCSFDPEASRHAQQELLGTETFLLAPEGEDCLTLAELNTLLQQALDRFQSLIYGGGLRAEEGDSISALQMTMVNDEPVELFQVSPTAQGGPFRVDDRNEGLKLEQAAYLVLDAVYPGRTYHSPRIRIANGTREIADALALGDRFACVIQAKALSVFGAASSRTSERRSSTLTKAVTEAVRQLQGSTRRMRSQRELLDAGGRLISWNQRETMPAHAIVLLSEMYAFLDWRMIARKTAEASESDTHRAFFHVMDLMELSFVAQQAPGADAFESIMLQRWATVQDRGTGYLRARAPLP